MQFHLLNKIVILLLLVCWFLIAPARSVDASNFGRPLAAEGPTEVKIAVFVLDVDEVSNVSQSFDANVYIELQWQDSRLAHKNLDGITRSLNEVWHPRIQFINQQKIWPTLPEIVEISPQGEVVYQQRVWGAFSQPLELEDFPFDHQTLKIQLVAAGYSTQEVNLTPGKKSRIGIAAKFSLADWEILGWNVAAIPFVPILDEESFAGFSLSMEGKRKYGYFIIKVIIPLFLIVMMSWVVFWIDPKESGTQISVAITTMLTLIAYRLSLCGWQRSPQGLLLVAS
jgi:hypothetical protein